MTFGDKVRDYLENRASSVSAVLGSLDATSVKADTISARSGVIALGDMKVTGSINPRKRNAKTIFVGPGGTYSKLSSAFDDLSPTDDNRYVLSLTDDITNEDSKIIPKDHIDVQGNGFSVESSVDDQAVKFAEMKDATWSDLVVDHRPATISGFRDCIRFVEFTEETFRMHNVVGIANQDSSTKAHGLNVRHGSKPTIENCLFVSGLASGSNAIRQIHNASPQIRDTVAYGMSDNFGSTVWLVDNAATPTLQNCASYGGESNTGYKLEVTGNAAPRVINFDAGPRTITNLLNATGDGSTLATTVPEYSSVVGMDDVRAYLTSISINITSAAAGATIKIGTSSNGSEIASGIDASSEARLDPQFTHVQFEREGFSPDTLHVSPSDQSVQYLCRFTMEACLNNDSGLLIDTHGPAEIIGGRFHGGNNSHGLEITDRALDQKDWAIRGASFKTTDGSSDAINVASSVGVDVPVTNVSAEGSLSNIVLGGRNQGSASVSDTDTISHGLGVTPSYVDLTASADKHIAVATSVGSSNITVGLHDDTGSAVTSDETVYWEAVE